MNNIVKQRSDRMYDILSNLKVERKFPLIAEHKLSDSSFSSLRNSLIAYLNESVSHVSPDNYDMCNDFFEKYSNKIGNLPNITPNGLLLPKSHNFLSYNLVYKEVSNIVQNFNLKNASHIHFPINIRIVDGTPNEAKDTRPKSSMKLHSDIWAGEFTNHIMIFFPIFGDMENNGVELYEPGPSFYPDFVKTCDYDEGKNLINDSIKYDIVMHPGSVYFLDSFLLHKTIKKKAGLRLAVNFAFLTDNKVESDLEIKSDRSFEYIESEEWFKYGKTKLLTTDAVLKKFTDEESRVSKTSYADKYNTIVLK